MSMTHTLSIPRNAPAIACGRETPNWSGKKPDLDSMKVMLEQGRLQIIASNQANDNEEKREEKEEYTGVLFGLLQVGLNCLCQEALIHSYPPSKLAHSPFASLQMVPTEGPEKGIKNLCFSTDDCRNVYPYDGFELQADFKKSIKEESNNEGEDDEEEDEEEEDEEEEDEEEDEENNENPFFHIGCTYMLKMDII